MGGRGRGKTTRRAHQPAPATPQPTDTDSHTPPRAKSRKRTVADNAEQIDSMQTQLLQMINMLTNISERFLVQDAQETEAHADAYHEDPLPGRLLSQTPRRPSNAEHSHETDRRYGTRARYSSASQPGPRRAPHRMTDTWQPHHDMPTNLHDIQESSELQGRVANFLSATLGPLANNGKKLYAHSYILKGPKKNKATLGELSLPEYNLGFIRLMNSPLVDLMDRQYMLTHLEYINEDAARYNWPDVRFWSEEVVHKIAEGSLTWDDEYRIDILRLSLAQQSRKSPTDGNREDPQADSLPLSDIPEEVRAAKPAPACRHFNAGTCTSRTHHVVNGYRYLHKCGHCIYNKCSYLPHPETTCRSKEFKKQKAAKREAQPVGFGK